MLQVPSAHPDMSWVALVKPTGPLEFWTLTLSMATTGLGVAAYFGLRSVALSRKDMRNRALREETQCAIDRCNEMGRELLPMFIATLHGLTARKVPVFVRDPAQVSFDKAEEDKKVADAVKWIGGLDSGLQNATIQLLNRLECWSMVFTTDPALADERVAFEPCSTVFCQMVMVLYASVLSQRRANPASGPYQHLVTLFQGWYAKKAQGPMLEQIRRLQTDGARLPPTIGTSLDSGRQDSQISMHSEELTMTIGY